MTTNYSTQSAPHSPKQSPVRVSSKALKAYIAQRLDEQRTLPTRLHVLFDDLNPRLLEHKQIDVFDLLVELILHADNDPAQYLCALMAVLDEEALFNLAPLTIAHSGAFVRDAMKRDSVRWHLQHYHDKQNNKKKQQK